MTAAIVIDHYSVPHWPEMIRTHLAATVESIVATASLLCDSKAALAFEVLGNC